LIEKNKIQNKKNILYTRRKLSGPIKRVVQLTAIFAAIYHLYIAGFGSTSAIVLRSAHWTFISVLVFILYPSPTSKNLSRDKVTIIDIVLSIIALLVGIYVFFNWADIAARGGFTNTRDTIFGIFEIIIVLEAARRVVGFQLTILSAIFLIYSFFGPYMPTIIAHKGYGITAVVRVLYMSSDGIFGIPIGISASYIVLFILFGSFLELSGGGKFLTDVAFSLVGRTVGGPAKAAVVSSGMMGMLSGAAVANVVTTGTFTIPLMKKAGYPKHVAAAIEAVASTGGQFVPPVMGAAAFMIAEMVGVSYKQIAIGAIIPSLLYYFYLYLCIHFEAKKAGLSGLKQEELPSLKQAFQERGHLIVPLIMLVFLIVSYSPAKAIFWSIIFIIPVSIVSKHTRMKIKDIFYAMEIGIQKTIPIASACAAAGIITGIISLTGLGLRFSSILINLSGNNIFLMLLLTMLASIIMGMGLPTSAAYIILAILTAPALIKLGVDPMAAHFFIFFFGCISTITPPVALSAYAAAGIAEANPMKTGFTAFKLGLLGYIIPFIGIYHLALFMKDSLLEIILFVFLSIASITAFTYGIEGFSNRILSKGERFLFIFTGIILLLRINWILNFIALMLLILLLFRVNIKRNLEEVELPSSPNHSIKVYTNAKLVKKLNDKKL